MTKHNKRKKVADSTPIRTSAGFDFDNGDVAFADPLETLVKRRLERERKRAESRARYVPKGSNHSRDMHTKHGRV